MRWNIKFLRTACLIGFVVTGGSETEGTESVRRRVLELTPTYRVSKLLVPQQNLVIEGYDMEVAGTRLTHKIPKVKRGDPVRIVYYWRWTNQGADRGYYLAAYAKSLLTGLQLDTGVNRENSAGYILARIWAYHTHYSGGIFPLDRGAEKSNSKICQVYKKSYTLDTKAYRPGTHSICVAIVGEDYDFKGLPWIAPWNTVNIGQFEIIE